MQLAGRQSSLGLLVAAPPPARSSRSGGSGGKKRLQPSPARHRVPSRLQPLTLLPARAKPRQPELRLRPPAPRASTARTLPLPRRAEGMGHGPGALRDWRQGRQGHACRSATAAAPTRPLVACCSLTSAHCSSTDLPTLQALPQIFTCPPHLPAWRSLLPTAASPASCDT